MPSVSVIIPARDAAATIGRTLRSLAPDAAAIAEILVVDDGSRDGTAQQAKAVAAAWSLPLRVIAVSAGNAGAARNAGIEAARAELVFMIDADDEVLPGGLARLVGALAADPEAGLSIGANIRRTHGRVDKLKRPDGYGRDPMANVRGSLTNRLWPIAMGSCLVRRAAIGTLRFDGEAWLDEDTVFWAAVLARSLPAVVPEPVLIYHLDEDRMDRRFLAAPEDALARIGRALAGLAAHGVPAELIAWRHAWVARRLARQLIRAGRFAEARPFLAAAFADRRFAHSTKAWLYRLRMALGRPRRPIETMAPLPVAHPPGAILLITNDAAWPPVSGYDQRNAALARSLARHAPVTLASLRPLPPGPPPPPGITILSLAGDAGEPALNRWRAQVEVRISVAAAGRIDALVQRIRPDLTVLAGVPLAALAPRLEGHAGRLVLDMHNVESDLQRQRARHGGPTTALRQRLEAARTARLEARAIRRVDAVLTCSRHDRDRVVARFRRLLPVMVVPNTVPAGAGDIAPAPAPPVLLFVGHLGYWPNVGAILRLAGAILPAIRAVHPGTRLVIAGRSPSARVRRAADRPGVTLIADPIDLAPLYRAATLAMIPLSHGGGTRIKILEAMSHGVPVVATAIAAEGLDLADGIDFLAADDDAGLAGHALALIEDDGRRRAIAARARLTAAAFYGEAALDDAVDQVVRGG